MLTFLIIYVNDHGMQDSIFLSTMVMIATFLTSYFVGYKLQFRRIQVLERVSKNISKKRFEEIEDLRTQYDDELDYIIKHLIKSSRTVEREIQRLNRIENYSKEFIGDISHELKTLSSQFKDLSKPY